MHQKLPLLVEVAIEPKAGADTDKLTAALEQLIAISARLDTARDSESGLTILRGTDEMALEKAIVQLQELGIPVNVGAPQVAYREVLTDIVIIDYTYKRPVSPCYQFARVKIEFAPLARGSGFIFRNDASTDAVPAEFIPAVEKGLRAQKDSGLLAGFPVIDFQANLLDGAYHEVDSSPFAFDVAARIAFRELANKNVVQLVEPLMKVEVATPECFLGGVIGDLNARRAQDLEATSGWFYQLVTALVPLANMFGYRQTLDAICQSRAGYEMEFTHYEPVPDPGSTDPTFPGAMGMRVA